MTRARSSMCDCAVLGAHVLKLIPGCSVLKTVDRVTTDREKRQRARQLGPGPFELQRRLEVALSAERDGHVAEDCQTISPSIRGGQAQLVEAVDDLREALLVRSPV